MQAAFTKLALAWCRGGDKLAEDKMLVSSSSRALFKLLVFHGPSLPVVSDPCAAV
jgi:hypothetical protein